MFNKKISIIVIAIALFAVILAAYSASVLIYNDYVDSYQNNSSCNSCNDESSDKLNSKDNITSNKSSNISYSNSRKSCCN